MARTNRAALLSYSRALLFLRQRVYDTDYQALQRMAHEEAGKHLTSFEVGEHFLKEVTRETKLFLLIAAHAMRRPFEDLLQLYNEAERVGFSRITSWGNALCYLLDIDNSLEAQAQLKRPLRRYYSAVAADRRLTKRDKGELIRMIDEHIGSGWRAGMQR